MVAVAAGGGGGGGGFTGEGGDGDQDSYFLLLELLDSLGDPTTTVTTTEPATVRVTVTKNTKKGKPVPDVVVTATADIGILSPESGTALTDEDGVAELLITSESVLGAGTVVVTVDAPSGTVEESITYQINFADLQLGYFMGDSFIPNEIGVNATSLPLRWLRPADGQRRRRTGQRALTVSS